MLVPCITCFLCALFKLRLIEYHENLFESELLSTNGSRFFFHTYLTFTSYPLRSKGYENADGGNKLNGGNFVIRFYSPEIDVETDG